MPTQPAILGTMRLGNFRLGYLSAALAAIRRTKVTILLAGLDARIRISGLTIHDVINAAPTTCSLVIDDANPPTTEDELRVTVGTAPQTLLFAGALQTTDQSYEGLTSQRVWPCTAIDTTARFNRRRPYGTWVNVSATVIGQALALFAPAFGTSHIEADLPIVPSFICDGSDDLIGAYARLATAIGGYTRVDDLDVYLFLEDTSDAPDPIDLTHPPEDDPPITCSIDVSQLRTTICGKGHGEAVLADVAAGETIIPIADGVMFGTMPGGGGRALAGTTPDGAQSQQIAYTGVQLGGGGSLVGPGAAPSVAPALALAAGSGLEVGVYGYAVVDVTAAGKSLPSPLATVTTGVTPAPATATTPATPVAGTGPDAGTHHYEVTFVTAAGETTPGPIGGPVTTGPMAAPNAAPVFLQLYGPQAFYNLTAGVYQWAVTWVIAGGGETTLSAVFTRTMAAQSAIALSLIATVPTGAVSLNVYRTVVNGSQLKFLKNLAVSTSSFFDDAADGSLGANAPTSNTATMSLVALTAIPIGNATVTNRKLYRRFNGTGTFKLLTTIANNTATTYTDTTPNASLGANAPSTNTAAVQQVSVSGIALGASPTTSREIYRTVVNGSQLKLLTTIANNTSTGPYVDSTADGSLGANAPAGDTSGISFAGGQVNAGSIAMPTASAGPFTATGGWALASGGQTVRYTGISGNTLIGIPASGPGALLTTVLYGSQILPAPALTGVTGLTLPMLKGAAVHIWVQRDDLVAQATQAALDAANGVTPADGIYEGPVVSDERRGEASLIALCDAQLQLFSTPIVTFTYATRDLKTRSGKTLHIDLPGYPVGDYVIQEVTITEIGVSPGTAPKFSVTASTVRFSLDDLLRRLLTAQAA